MPARRTTATAESTGAPASRSRGTSARKTQQAASAAPAAEAAPAARSRATSARKTQPPAPAPAVDAAPASRSRATSARKSQQAAPAPAAEAGIAPMQTFGEHTGARPFPVLAETDEKLNTRSFQIPIGVVERLRATADAIQHRAYETELEDRIPDSISGLLVELINAGCTYYEDLFNNGQPFRRVRRLPPGPGRSGAQRGAALRSEAAAAKRAAKTSG